MCKNNKPDAKDIFNDAYIEPNEINDEETQINNIFIDSIHPISNSTKNVNPAILYEKMNFQNTLVIPKNDISVGCFSSQSLLSKLNKDTPTSLSSVLNEEMVNKNNHDIILINKTVEKSKGDLNEQKKIVIMMKVKSQKKWKKQKKGKKALLE